MAQIGAVIGREFSFELLAAVASLGEAELTLALDQLVDSELVFRRGTPPDVVYSFKHALMQDAAYESLLKSKRQMLHARIAEAIEERFPEIGQDHPELLAHHCTEAGLVDQAVENWKRAAQVAMGRSATAEAIAHSNSGLKVLLSLPESDARHRQELGIQLAIGSAYVAARGFAAPETGQAYQRARELCEALDDIDQLFPVLYGLCLFYLYSSDLDGAWAASSRLLEMAKTSNDRGSLFFAHRAAGVSSYPAGYLAQARDHLEKALELYDPEQHRTPAFVYAFDPRVVCLDYLARSLFPMGLVNQALARNDEAVGEARRIGHRNSLALPLFFGGTLRQQCGEHGSVRERADELLVLAEEEGFRFWLAGGTILKGWAETQEGTLEAGARVMREGVEEWLATGADFMVPYFLTLLAETEIALGRIGEARALLEDALSRIARSDERWFEAESHRILGQVYRTAEARDDARAEASYRKAMEVAQAQGAHLWQLRAVLGLGELWTEQGKESSLLELLGPVYATFTESFDLRELQTAARLLGRSHPPT